MVGRGTEKRIAAVNVPLSDGGLILRACTQVDATTEDAQSSTKNNAPRKTGANGAASPNAPTSSQASLSPSNQPKIQPRHETHLDTGFDNRSLNPRHA